MFISYLKSIQELIIVKLQTIGMPRITTELLITIMKKAMVTPQNAIKPKLSHFMVAFLTLVDTN